MDSSQLLLFGKMFFEEDFIDNQLSLVLSILKRWFSCETEFFHLEIKDLEQNKDKLLYWIKGIPKDLIEFLIGIYSEFSEVTKYLTETSHLTQHRPNRTIVIPLVLESYLVFVRLNRDRDKFKITDLDDLKKFLVDISLMDSAKRQIKQSKLIYELSNLISSILDLDSLYDELARLLHDKLGYPYVYIFSVHPGMRKFVLKAFADNNKINLEQSLDIDLEGPGSLPLAFRTKKSIVYHDVLLDDTQHKIEGFFPEAGSELAVPIIHEEDVLGIILVKSERFHDFTKDEIELLERLSNNVAIAIRNAELYRSERWRRRVADGLREAAGLLTTGIDLNKLLDRLLLELEKVLPCDFSSIWLLEDKNYKDEKRANNGLFLAAVHILPGNSSYYLEEGITADVVQQVCNQSTFSNPWLYEVLSANQAVIRTSQTPYEPIASILNFPDNYSAIATPLFAGGSVLGILVLGHHEPGRYGQEAKLLTSTFASYASVAIQNTRLYKSAHDQAWVSTVLLQVADATQSLTDLDQLLETMARITPTLIGVNACVIFLWNEDLNTFLPKSAYGLDEEAQYEILRWTIRRGEFPEFDQLITSKSPVFISKDIDAEKSMRLYSLFSCESGLLALFPMIFQGSFLGAFLIDFKENFLREQPGLIEEGLAESIAIIQGIAHLTSVAVSNINLLESQKEEAYVSMALLQVAQAVVSLNTLHDILSTIVRITPILAGMKRVAVYLWDEIQNVFTLYQSYGISRLELSEIQNSFRPDEFPLIKSVMETLNPVFAIYDEKTDSPKYWKNIPVESMLFSARNYFENDNNDSLGKAVGILGHDRQILSVQSGLIYSFPLSVKGVLLGVFLVQEVFDPENGISSRIRSRRLEIALGIAQQASLAIQSEKLQREVVERERLERELQLAREIQQSFLPNFLPSFPGWELDIRWRPAREVGGDFYDAFILPGNRLGVVIADVADKGIPAALFMTLVRTLIRATIREELSPANVLEIVNDLLVSETEHGLFITVFYMVVTPQTGLITYANAGHNPPLVLRSQSDVIDKLSATGMALGVLENIQINEGTLTLNPGDAIVLYTDGLTEAFSSSGEMFGEDRVISILMEIDNRSVVSTGDLLDLLDRKVQIFCDGNPLADDLTLVAVRRLV